MYSPADDIELMRRIAERDQQALWTLYQQYGKAVYSLAYRILGNSTYAEEATQDTFLKVWNQTTRWDSEKGKLKNWLLTIAQFTAIDRLRKEGRQPVIHPESIEETDESLLTSKNEARWQDGTVLRLLVMQLPQQQASLIELAFFEGMTHGEIAESLHIPLGTVKTRLRAGLQKLRELWLESADQTSKP
ncbi:MAG TPA: sigma-70 family RNA polymerase sigma factor [Phototrophicaceae bacterium]|nr:sigma-70 family RNA polymerase sigma factor [Phototrophicaceae bacterium]